MRRVGIVCEYNPLHRGHAYLLARAREYGEVVCVMSGNFTQRGEAAILPPTVRAQTALCAGADLVVELPFPFAAASAEHFARGAVRALAELGVDTLLFGSECADVDKLTEAAKRIASGDFLESQAALDAKKGAVRVLFSYLGETYSSNDLLGIYYIKAILEEGVRIEPIAIGRIGARYRDKNPENALPSASAIRTKCNTDGGILPFLPEETRAIAAESITKYGFARTERLGTAILALLRGNGVEKSTIAECEGGLLARLRNAADRACDYEELCALAASKSYTDGRIRRAILMLLAGVTPEELRARPAYLRILAAGEKGREILAKCRKTSTVPLLTKAANAARYGERAARAQALARISDGLYALCFSPALSPCVLQTMPPVMQKTDSEK